MFFRGPVILPQDFKRAMAQVQRKQISLPSSEITMRLHGGTIASLLVSWTEAWRDTGFGALDSQLLQSTISRESQKLVKAYDLSLEAIQLPTSKRELLDRHEMMKQDLKDQASTLFGGGKLSQVLDTLLLARLKKRLAENTEKVTHSTCPVPR